MAERKKAVAKKEAPEASTEISPDDDFETTVLKSLSKIVGILTAQKEWEDLKKKSGKF